MSYADMLHDIKEGNKKPDTTPSVSCDSPPTGTFVDSFLSNLEQKEKPDTPLLSTDKTDKSPENPDIDPSVSYGSGGGAIPVVFSDSPDLVEERAAIIQEGAKCPQEWAEGYARLSTAQVPASIPPARWQTFIDDCGLFIDQWAHKAAQMGWEAVELFGLDHTAPMVRVDQAGLIWLVKGRTIVALTADSAVLENHAGSRLTYTKKSRSEDRRVLAWESK